MPDLHGKVAVITGATSGIGRGVAHGLAALGATTVVVGRSQDQTTVAAQAIASQTGNADVHPVRVTDLALRTEVARLATVLLDTFPRVDLLVNNAGAYFHHREVTTEGLERTFALNVLAPFLLTARLGPRLVESAPARVLMVSSEAHQGRRVDFDDLQADHGYRGFRQYGASKLELLLLSREFARRFAGQGVTVNAVHPGFVASGFGRNNRGGVGFGLGLLARLFGRSVRSAAADLVFDVTDPSFDAVTGAYISRRRIRPGSVPSREMADALRLYEQCVGLVQPFL